MQDVHQGDLRREEPGRFRRGDADDDQQVFREFPECVGDFQTAVHSPQYAGVPSGQAAEEYGT